MLDRNTKTMFSNVKLNRIKREGDYTIQLSNNEKIDIKISNYNIY